MSANWLDDIHWDAQGLVPAVAQDAGSGRILMLAWMDREALQATRDSGWAHYYSRSRQRQWCKGESSGHRQQVHEMRLDCDGDVIVLVISQQGGIACHTGRESCFYRRLEHDQWVVVDPVRKDPETIYGREHGHQH